MKPDDRWSLGSPCLQAAVLGAIIALSCGLWALGAEGGPITATFTADDGGTFPRTLKFDRQSRVLEIDLSAVPSTAMVFRAELVLRPPAREEQRPVAPTRVYPVDHPDRPLRFVGPRFVSLDALAPVQAAVRNRRPLVLRVENTCNGIARLEVSYTPGRTRASAFPAVEHLRATHRNGQTLLVFAEPRFEPFPDFATGGDVRRFARAFLKRHTNVWFRVWRSPVRITPETIARAHLVGELGFFTAWNSGYHQDATDKQPPLRYRVEHLGEPVAWGTGIYAHNPETPGQAYYAVTVTVEGEEDFSALGAGNTTKAPVREEVGPGDPILQWVETPERWMYRHAEPGSHITRLIFTRWESWPRASRPSVPIDYLIAMGNDPPGTGPDSHTLAARVEPAPVGLHLHCWGGSLNGGYGWWYNAHRGAVLIAANQVPYDWWTGYHEALGTCKTFGDGFVHPFTMNRMFAFLDWAARRWPELPRPVSRYARPLDLKRVFVAGSSMGGSGAPMYSIRHGDRVAWALGWVGVHVPEDSPQFKSSYRQCYGPRSPSITMPDGKTSPWDYFSDVWWLRQHPSADTGFVIASNGKNDGGIGWPQALAFARALQETRRPHLFNWGLGGHGTRTLIGANFDLDLRTDQSLPAFTHCTLDDDPGTGTPKSKADLEAERRRQEAEVKAGRRREVRIDPYDGDPQGAFNAWLRWATETLVDRPDEWAVTVILLDNAPKAECRVDLTPRRLQAFRTPHGAQFKYEVVHLPDQIRLAAGSAEADAFDLLTLRQIPLRKGRTRVSIRAAAR